MFLSDHHETCNLRQSPSFSPDVLKLGTNFHYSPLINKLNLLFPTCCHLHERNVTTVQISKLVTKTPTPSQKWCNWTLKFALKCFGLRGKGPLISLGIRMQNWRGFPGNLLKPPHSNQELQWKHKIISTPAGFGWSSTTQRHNGRIELPPGTLLPEN